MSFARCQTKNGPSFLVKSRFDLWPESIAPTNYATSGSDMLSRSSWDHNRFDSGSCDQRYRYRQALYETEDRIRMGSFEHMMVWRGEGMRECGWTSLVMPRAMVGGEGPHYDRGWSMSPDLRGQRTEPMGPNHSPTRDHARNLLDTSTSYDLI